MIKLCLGTSVMANSLPVPEILYLENNDQRYV